MIEKIIFKKYFSERESYFKIPFFEIRQNFRGVNSTLTVYIIIWKIGYFYFKKFKNF